MLEKTLSTDEMSLLEFYNIQQWNLLLSLYQSRYADNVLNENKHGLFEK